MTEPASLVITTSRPQALSISALFGGGVGIDTHVGTPLVELLCTRIGISPDYLDQRVQTIFVNGRTVDRPEEVAVTDGAIVALSAAMPGLMGATLRKGGLLAVFRKDISQMQSTNLNDDHRKTMITLKLFNLVARELGPMLLQQGVWLKSATLAKHFNQIPHAVLAALDEVVWNGRTIPAERLQAIRWPEGWVKLVVHAAILTECDSP
jgi:hypothetical protein